MTKEEQTIWLAALLHDIGKFRERTSVSLPAWADSYRTEARYSHEPFGAVFVDEFMNSRTEDIRTLRWLVLKHHDPSLYDERLIALSDRLSAYERAEVEGDEEGARGRAETVLRTVLSRVELDGRCADMPLYHKLVSLSFDGNTLIPEEGTRGSQEAYQILWEAFKQEIFRVSPGDFSTFLAILKKFTWAVPSDTRRDTIPDISLYDHLKTTAAIAVCLIRQKLSEHEVAILSTALTQLFKEETLAPSEEAILNRPICALVKGDISVVVIHSHPSGDIFPSEEDQTVFKVLTQSGDLLKIPVLDCIIMAAGSHEIWSLERSKEEDKDVREVEEV